MILFKFLLILSIITIKIQCQSNVDYFENKSCLMHKAYDSVRDKIIEAERLLAIGGNVWLSSKEIKANSILMNAKKHEIEEGIKNPHMYPPGMHFFHAKPLIRQSEVFRIITKMPKGALLHGHQFGIVSSKWIIKNLTSQFNVYSCRDNRGVLLFTFRNNTKCSTPLENICLERANSPDRRQYDRQLEKHINMYTMHPESSLVEPSNLWQRFEDIFDSTSDFYKYMPVYRAYNKRLLEELYEDNIIYAEIRGSLSSVYGENNETYTEIQIANELENIVNDFKMKNPDFIGMKVIYAKKKKMTSSEICKSMETFKDLFHAKPNFVIGFDLIGQEDIGEPLHKFIDELSELPSHSNFFFHAGETKWYGKYDLNLMDAILLNTRRIGHGYALSKHPQLWDTIKTRKIAVEINPISNQVMGLIWDLRNHPASFYIAENMPIIISSDDPGIWNSKGISYDFYYAFMSFTSVDADLRVLKQFALNSIKYSVLTNAERRKFNEVFKKRWDHFIDDVINLRF